MEGELTCIYRLGQQATHLEGELTCIYVNGIDFASVSTIQFDLVIVLVVCYFILLWGAGVIFFVIFLQIVLKQNSS